MRVGRTSVAVLVYVGLVAVATAAASDRLIEAVQAQDHATVRALLEEQVDVNAAEGDGATALHWAVVRDDPELVALLLDAGAEVDAANDYGVGPLSLACTNRNAAMVERLLDAGADPDVTTLMGETALMTCARTGSAAAVAALLDRGATTLEAREASHGQTALMWAATQSNPDVVRVLLEHGADVHARSDSYRLPVSLGDGNPFEKYVMQPQRGSTPLLFAARHGRIENARLLIEAGADVDDTAPSGESALVLASFSGQGAFARFLLDRGADPHADAAGYTALHTAVSRGDLALVEALCAAGADPNHRLWQGSRQTRNMNFYALSGALVGATPFWLAAKYAEVDIMRVLVAHGADPWLSPDTGTTPLMAAAGAGWNTQRQNRRGQSIGVDAARLLAAAGEPATLAATTLAVELGNDVNAADPDGNTALHAAVRLAYPTVVDLLVGQGGRLDLANQSGQTPADLMCLDADGALVPRVGGRCPEVAR